MNGAVTDKKFHGLEIELRALGGARAVRVIHPCRQLIGEHAYDWPSLTLPLLGGCSEIYDGGEAAISGPSAILHPARSPHADWINEGGMETVSLQFDPAWLRYSGFHHHLDRSLSWTGGAVGAAAHRLSVLWATADTCEAVLRDTTAAFLHFALTKSERTRPSWIGHVIQALEGEPTGTGEIARQLDLNPAWLARAYRAAAGEGLHETLRRKRVERAIALLRGTDLASAEVAAAAGFCDQSHMNRSVRMLIGRTPLNVRQERGPLFALPSAAWDDHPASFRRDGRSLG